LKTVERQRTAVIIGAGPAGLTAAYELLSRTDIKPIVLEKSGNIGGLSRTIRYKGNRMDIGGHRFFSKSDRVMNWWLKHMPLANETAGETTITYHRQTRSVATLGTSPLASALAVAEDAERDPDAVMLLRPRKSRIYFLRTFFSYPLQLSWDTLSKLGPIRTARIALSYLRSVLLPVRPVKNLEDFFIARFGRELYATFFKSYTEKVWGTPCFAISAEWGEQRIKGLSVKKTIAHHLKRVLRPKDRDFKQKNTETSLIEQFLYPKYGPGQMWEEVARKVETLGGRIVRNAQVTKIATHGQHIRGVVTADPAGCEQRFDADFLFSTMPVTELVRSLDCPVPADVREVSCGLQYRDFITVGLLLKSLRIKDSETAPDTRIADNWIYIQEPGVLAGRLQIFNNWSPHLVADQDHVWLGVEYFCYETDPIWKLDDAAMAQLAREELQKIGIIDQAQVLDWHVERVPKAYPAYFGTYERFDVVRQHLDNFQNLFLIGRNGMHKYNNQDHSMLTAMIAVDNIITDDCDKSSIWEVNTEVEYHEAKP
jgi:protoporphyrinogen oxidase